MKKKYQILVVVLFGILLIGAVSCFALFSHYGNVLKSQEIAAAWRGDNEERFSQVSAFFPVGTKFSVTDVYDFRGHMEQAFLDVSLEAEEGLSLYTDCYSANGKLTVKTPKGVSAEVPAVGIGGDFFRFHEYKLLSGGYIAEDDLMHDRVVIDKELAWRLYGASDLEGMEVIINGETYIIAGVIERETDFATQRAYNDGAGIFVHYETLSPDRENPLPIDCYEVVMPDPISGFAEDTLIKGLQAFEPVVVENTGRYGIERTLSVIGDFGDRSMITEGVIYPYWENAARLLEDYAARCLLLAMVFGVYPLLCIVIVVIAYIRKLNRRIKSAVPRYLEQMNDRRYDRRAEKHQLKEREKIKLPAGGNTELPERTGQYDEMLK